MNNKGDDRQLLPEETSDQERIIFDVPPALLVPHTGYIPDSYSAMGHTDFTEKGRRTSSSVPWWMMFTGWFVAGMVIFSVVAPISLLKFILLAVVVLLPLVLLWYGITTKPPTSRVNQD